jgi:quercetin dioxygenase-like cupin family protein
MERQRNATSRGPAEWFTGNVLIDSVAQTHGEPSAGVAFVRFSPGARTAWHTHSNGQTLHVTEGEGRFQTRGDPVEVIRPGDIIWIPADEWHWHAAAPDRSMTHLAISEGSPTWGEHVTDEEYGTG